MLTIAFNFYLEKTNNFKMELRLYGIYSKIWSLRSRFVIPITIYNSFTRCQSYNFCKLFCSAHFVFFYRPFIVGRINCEHRPYPFMRTIWWSIDLSILGLDYSFPLQVAVPGSKWNEIIILKVFFSIRNDECTRKIKFVWFVDYNNVYSSNSKDAVIYVIIHHDRYYLKIVR